MSTTIYYEHDVQANTGSHKVGSWFMVDDRLCQLVQVDNNEVNLVYVKTGNRFDSPIHVSDICNVPASVVAKLAHPYRWQRVSVEITTKPYKP